MDVIDSYCCDFSFRLESFRTVALVIEIAKKILNDDDVITYSSFDILPSGKEINKIPKTEIIACDWNKDAYLKPKTIKYNSNEYQLLDIELIIDRTNTIPRKYQLTYLLKI